MDDYGAFSTHELWRPSIFTVDSNPENSIFEGLQLDAISSLTAKKTDANLFDGLADEFGLPPLDDVPLDTEVEQGLSQDLQAKPQLEDHETEQSDVWDLDIEPTPLHNGPQFHTWEAFQLEINRPPHPAYFSEAGDGAFDALFQQREPSSGVIQHDATLKACCSLVLGRSSMFCQWDATKRSFVPTLDHVSLSGVSLSGSQSLFAHFMNAGTVFRDLVTFVASTSTRDCTAMVALRRSISTVLDRLESHVCEQIVHITSLLQLQEAIDRPWSIMSYIHSLVGRLRRCSTDEELISMLSDDVTTLAESGNMLAHIMKQILAHTSMPWLQRLSEDLGLSTSLRSSNPASTMDSTGSAEQEMLPEATFLEGDDNRSLTSVRQSIRLLRQHVPEHPLVKPDASLSGHGLLQSAADSTFESVVQQAHGYRNRMTDALAQCQRGGGSHVTSTHSFPADEHTPAVDGSDPFALSSLDNIPNLEHGTSVGLPPNIDAYCNLQSCIHAVLQDSSDDLDEDLAQNDRDILSPLRPFIEVQASLVHGAVLGYLFHTYRLRDHLELHRSYHFFGNGDFVTRLTTALFSDDVQSAERKRGNIPTSETMGLRLGSRDSQRWPPASSELRLTLLNVLTESYTSGNSQQDKTHLPGGLSFAIRELSDAEIDKVMDPTSVYALDFLRLQYTPPSPLADIFTPAIVQHYDSVFRMLLVQVRVLHATSQLAMLCHKEIQRDDSDRTVILRRFAWKARHFSTTIFSHFTGIVIADSWKSFTAQLDVLQPAAEGDGPSGSKPQSADLHTVTRLHEACLDDIRSKLFLRHKHSKIRSVLDELAGVVIKSMATAQQDDGAQAAVADQDRSFDALSKEFRSLLEALASKPPKDDRAGAYGQSAQSESDAAKLLLARLSW